MDDTIDRLEAECLNSLRREMLQRSPEGTEEAEEGEYGSDSCPTEPRLRAATHCGRSWVIPLNGGSHGDELPRVHPACEGPDYGSAIARVCNELRDFLLEKNASYGNSAFEPINVFSQLPPLEGILLRIDDKLKRIRNGRSYPGDNDVKDLTGYLVLLQVLSLLETNNA